MRRAVYKQWEGLFTTLWNGILKYQERIYLPELCRSDIECCKEIREEIMISFHQAYPEAFFIDNRRMTFVYVEDRVYIKPSYRMTKQQTIQLWSNMKAQILNFCRSVSHLPQEKQLLALRKWFRKNIQYCCDTDSCYEITGVYLNRQACCEGISKAAALTLHYLNIPAFLCSGTHNSGDRHGWVCAKVNGVWRHYDFTFELNAGLRPQYWAMTERQITEDRHWNRKACDFVI